MNREDLMGWPVRSFLLEYYRGKLIEGEMMMRNGRLGKIYKKIPEYIMFMLLVITGCGQQEGFFTMSESATPPSPTTLPLSLSTPDLLNTNLWMTPTVTIEYSNDLENPQVLEEEPSEEIEIVGECLTGAGGILTGAIDVSPDGQYIAIRGDGMHYLYIMKLDQSQLYSQVDPRLWVTISHLEQEAYQLAWSPDGQRLAILAQPSLDEFFDNVPNYAGREQIYVISPDGQQKVRLTDTPEYKGGVE